MIIFSWCFKKKISVVCLAQWLQNKAYWGLSLNLWANLCKLRKYLGQIVLPAWLLENLCGLHSTWDTEPWRTNQWLSLETPQRTSDSLVWNKWLLSTRLFVCFQSHEPTIVRQHCTLDFLWNLKCPFSFCLQVGWHMCGFGRDNPSLCLLSQHHAHFSICPRIFNFNILLWIVALK